MLNRRILCRTPDSILYTEIWKDATFTDEERGIYPCVELEIPGTVAADSHRPAGGLHCSDEYARNLLFHLGTIIVTGTYHE